MSYVVKYHPEGWRDANTETPEEDGRYIVAYQSPERKSVMTMLFRKNLGWEFGYVTHWQPLPTPPWEIFPKENTDA